MHGGAYIRVVKRVTNLGGLYSGELIYGILRYVINFMEEAVIKPFLF